MPWTGWMTTKPMWPEGQSVAFAALALCVDKHGNALGLARGEQRDFEGGQVVACVAQKVERVDNVVSKLRDGGLVLATHDGL